MTKDVNYPYRLEGKNPLEVLLKGLSHFNGREYWLSAGTLLGFHRDGGFIPYDTDIDIAVFGDKEIALPPEFKPLRFIDIGRKPMQRAYVYQPTNVIFDIFHYYEAGKKIYNTQEKGTIKRTAALVKPLITKEYLDHKFTVPNDIDAYLTEWYGDWRTPAVGGKTEWAK